MKSKFYLPLIAMAIGIGSCTNDLVEEVNPIMGQRDVIAVSVDDANTRTAMDGNNVVWSEDDAIGIFVGNTNNKYILTSDPGTTSGDFASEGLVVASAETIKEAAYFPYVQGATWANNVISTTLPSTYPYAEGTNNNAVMAALMAADAQSSISFQNAGALYAITIENIPEGYTKAVMTYLGADDKVGIAGAATITFADGVPTLAVPDAADAASAQKTITITFTGTGNKTFYFPMPVKTEGYAGKLQFSLQGEGKDAITAPVFTKEPVRSNLYSVTLKLDNVSGGIVTEASDIDAANTELAKDAVTSVAVKDATDTDAITIPAKSAESAAVAHTIDLSEATLPTTGSVEIVVTEGTGEKATVENLTVIVPEGTSAGSYNIDAPGTTVTIQGADGTVIETIEAVTAENTLIIAEGVTVNKLVLKGGNVRNSGTISSIVDANYNEYTWVTTVDELTTAIAGNKNIILGANITSTGIITINRALTLNGNGYTLKNTSTSTSIRALNIEVNGEVTIKNLTVDASCQRAFNVINQPATLTLDNVTATAKNYAVMVATSAGAARLNIKNSDLTGAATINIAGAKTTATITDTDITSIDNSAKEGYGAITISAGADDANVTVTRGSITLSGTQGDDSFAGYSLANGASITFNDGITFDGVTEENKIGSSACYIPYSNQTAYGFTSLAEALEWAKGGETIVLSADVEINSTLEITKNVTIDLNGKSLTNNVSAARAFKLNADGVSFTMNATDANITFGNGTYGMIEIATGVDNATVNVNGGTFEGTTDCGAFVKLRDGNNNTVSLSDVTYTEKCELQDGNTNAWVISASTGTGNQLTVSGGTYNVACGFGLNKFTSTFENVKLTAKGMGMEIAENTSTVKGCTITVDPGKPVNKIYASCIAASTQSVVTVEESTIEAGENAYALYVLPTGGTINVDSETTITGTEYIHDPMKDGCTGEIKKEAAQ